MTELSGANKASGPESALWPNYRIRNSSELAINSTHYNNVVPFIEEQICCWVSVHLDKEALKTLPCNKINKYSGATLTREMCVS